MVLWSDQEIHESEVKYTAGLGGWDGISVGTYHAYFVRLRCHGATDYGCVKEADPKCVFQGAGRSPAFAVAVHVVYDNGRQPFRFACVVDAAVCVNR